MKVLLTGGAGYIGSVLVGQLLKWITLGQGGEDPENGFSSTKSYTRLPTISKLTVVDNLIRGQNSLGQYCDDPRFEFIYGDITDADLMISVLDRGDQSPDVIIPLAGVVGAPRCERFKERAWTLNYECPISMLKELFPHQKVIYPCTNSGYGSSLEAIPITEDAPLKPISTYGRTKVKTEEKVLEFGGVSLRLATVMGWSPCMRLDLLVNDFVWQAVKRGNIVLYEKGFKRNYVHVDDVCQAFLLAITNYDKMKGKAFNVGLSSANLTKEGLAMAILEQVNYQIVEAPLMKDPDKRDYNVSNARIEALGFSPQWDMQRSVRQLVKFYSTVSLNSANIYFENWR